jgi:hypothetical protein
VGACVQIVAGDSVQVGEVKSGSSYLSQEDLRLLFGLGTREQADLVEVRWPSGIVQRFKGVEAGQSLTVQEPRGAGR